MASSSSSSSPDVSHVVHPPPPDRFSFKYASQDDVLEDLSRSAFYPHLDLRLIQYSFQSFHSQPTRRGACFRRTNLFPGGTSVSHLIARTVFLVNRNSSVPHALDIGTMKTLSGKKIQNFLPCLSKSSLPCCSIHAHS